MPRSLYLLAATAVLAGALLVAACSGSSRHGATTGDVTGTVVEERIFSPVANARVDVAGGRAWSDASGAFTLTGVTPGTYTLTVTADGYARYDKSILVAVGANDLGQLWLQRAGDGGTGDGGIPGDGGQVDAPAGDAQVDAPQGDAAPTDGPRDAAQGDARADAAQNDAARDGGQADGPCGAGARPCATGCCAWVFTDLEAVGTGEYAAIKLDSAGRPHLAYGDDGTPRVRYARWNGTSWTYETVASVKGLYVSLALDASDRPRVVYVDATSNALQYASRASGSWVVTTVDNAASFCAVNVDGAGTVHVGYRESQNQVVKHATSTNDSTFAIENVDTVGNPGWYASMDVSPAGAIHLVYFTDQTELRYARKDMSSSGWTKQVIDAVPYSVGASSTSISLDGSGNPNVAYREYGSPSRLKYASRSGTTWQIVVLQDYYELGSVSIATSPVGLPQVITWDHLNANLVWGDVTVGFQVLSDNKKPGLYGRAITIDSGGNPHIVYTTHTTPRVVGYLH